MRLSSWGPRPAAGRAEARAHRLVGRVFRRAGLRVGTQEFPVPGRGRSRNTIGVLQTPATCLRIVMAHADTTPNAPGANDNASGVGVVAALAGRLDDVRPRCDVWLVATGAEERVYTGSPDHLGALALARRARARVPISWVRDESTGNSDHRALRGDGSAITPRGELLGLPAAKLGVGAGGEPGRHSSCDTPDRLDPVSLRLARRLVESAIGAHSAAR